MTLRELLCNHNRSQIEEWTRARARTAYVGDAVLCRILGSHNMYVDPKNYDMAPWLMLDGLWEMWVGMAIGRAIQPGWVCLDVGAWCGYYSVLMAELVGPTGKVWAYEPNQKHYELCQRSLLANGHTWTYCWNVAVGGENKNAKFLLTDGGGSRLHNEGTKTTLVRTIDHEDYQRVDLIKMDIEGGERDAWDGMQSTIERNPNIIIVMEWEPMRYNDAENFAKMIAAKFPLREITTDGLTTNITNDDLLKPVMRNLWLQQ